MLKFNFNEFNRRQPQAPKPAKQERIIWTKPKEKDPLWEKWLSLYPQIKEYQLTLSQEEQLVYFDEISEFGPDSLEKLKEVLARIKGKKNYTCNRTDCQDFRANYFNLSTRKYYCKSCALKINYAEIICIDSNAHPDIEEYSYHEWTERNKSA